MEFTFDVVIFDLDGTLSNHEHRNYLAPGDGGSDDGDWDAFTMASRFDTPYHDVCNLARELFLLSEWFVIWTGRGAKARKLTEQWLISNCLDYDELRMRPIGCATMDSEMKRAWYREEFLERKVLAFEDRKRVVDMWREEGVRCFQTQPGDF